MSETITQISEYVVVKGIVDEDFVNYKVPSMTIMFPKCTFKCEVDGSNYCHNSSLVKEQRLLIIVVEKVVRN